MFESKETRSWVGLLCAVVLHGNELRWLTWGNESSQWRGAVALPEGVGAGSVVAVYPSPQGLSLLTKAVGLFFRDHARNQWIRCGDVLKDGERT